MRTVEELMATSDPAWPELERELAANAEIRILPISEAAGRDCLYRLQVTARSRLGAVALHTGGLLVDHGWVRVLGGGGDSGLPSLAQANELPGDQKPPSALLVGHDVLGGRFEVNGADPATIGRPGDPGEVCYFGPDTLEWESLGAPYSAWLSWLAGGATTEFYQPLRWPGWREEISGLPLSHGITVYPFLWSRQAQENLAATTRAPAPLAELFGLQADIAAQLAANPDGTEVDIRVVE
ncbi:MAG: DUF2625 family protein [Micromonosporaceae bacterium]|nr:DUF2625 family protein [Micromonosporaceae bacterium]